MSLEKAIELYKAYLEHSNRAVGTRKSNQTWLAPFLEFCSSKGVTKLEELDSEVLAAYRQHLFWTPGKRGVLYSQNTLFQAQRMVRAFLTWCFQTELVWKNLTEGWVLRRPPDPPRNVPTVAEISRLMSVPDLTTSLGVRNRALLELLYGTGIRAEECFKLNLDSVDLENSRLVVHGKGNKFRALPLGPHLRQCLTRYLEVRDSFGVESAEEALFVSPSSRARLGQGSISIIVRESAITAGLGSFGPHTLRHSFATHLLESGADVTYIQALLGHAKIVTTEIYTRVRPLELLKEHRRTHPRAKRKRKGSKASDGE